MSDRFPDMAEVYAQPARARLKVFNPSSDKRRQGLVVTDWEPIAAASGVAPERVKLFAMDQHVRAQVDHLVPGDPSKDRLAFLIEQPMNIGDDYGSPSALVNVGDADPDTRFGAKAELFPTGAKLYNDRIEVWVNTSTDREESKYQCFGGAITNVLRFRTDDQPFELLDGIAAASRLLGHCDKRLQVDRVRLMSPPWEPADDKAFQELAFHDMPWNGLAKCEGPARACVTLASAPFPYETSTPGGKPIKAECTVYRVISINFGDDVVYEEIWVEAKLDGGVKTDLYFTVRYFMMTDLGPEPAIFRYPSVSGWFAIASEVMALHGYGFASNCGAGALWTPPMDWPDEDLKDRAFAWEVGAAKRIRAAHVFTFGRRQEIADAAGAAWFGIFKPLTGSLA
jgi:hypothetical protein